MLSSLVSLASNLLQLHPYFLLTPTLQAAILSYILEGPYIFLLTQQMPSHQRTVMIISKPLKAHTKANKIHTAVQ